MASEVSITMLCSTIDRCILRFPGDMRDMFENSEAHGNL